MAFEESPEAKFDRLKKQLQQAILRDYPNPERKGCPDGVVLRALAEKPLDQPVENDPHWQHITHCSECYREFLAFNEAFRQRRKQRQVQVRWALVLTAAVALLVAFLGLNRGLLVPKRPQNAELAYLKLTVDVPSMSRSGNGEEPPPIYLERRPMELAVNLPIGSKPGRYEIQLQKDETTLLSTAADARLQNGTTAFLVRMDLTKFVPGDYKVNVRQIPFDWNYYPVTIR